MGASRGGEPGTPWRNRGILGSIATGWLLILGLRYLIPAILPQIKAAFAIDNATAGVAITGIWLGYGVMQFPAGLLVDRYDERTLLTASLGLAAGSLLVIGFAPVFAVFFVACTLFGLTTGLFGTTRGIALSRFFTANPGRAFGVTLAAGSVGSAVFPYASTAMTETVGWRLGLGLTVPLFLVVATSTWVVLPGGKPEDEEDQNPSLGNVTRMLRTIATDRSIGITFVATTLLLFTFQALTAFLPTYLIQEKGLPQGTASTLFAVMFLAGAGFQLLGGSSADRYGTRMVVIVLSVVGIVTLVGLPFVEGVGPLALLIVVLASRVGIPSVLNPYIIALLPEELTGSGWGLLRTLFFVVGATGSTVVGVLADSGLFDEAFYLLGALTALATGLFFLLPKERVLRS